MSLTLTEATDPDRDGDSAQVEAEPVAPEPTFLGRVSAGTDRLFRMRRGSAGAKRASAPFVPDRRRMSAAEVSWSGLGFGLFAKFTRHARVHLSEIFEEQNESVHSDISGYQTTETCAAKTKI